MREEEGQTAAEKTRALALLGTFMVAAGLLTGEAFFGTESSILSFIDSVLDEEFANSRAWWAARMGMLIGLNVFIGGAIYWLFKAAGVIGGDDEAEASAA